MPEHIHLVLHPPDGLALGMVIGQLKSLTARKVFGDGLLDPALTRTRLSKVVDGAARSVLWQRRCYDHNCRTPEKVTEKINYCHNNPVKRGLVGSPGDWIFSSYRWYSGASDVPLEMDELH